MTNMVKLGAVSVDADDPCALFQALYLVKLRLISGDMTGEYSIQSPVTRESVVFSPANLKALDSEMNRLRTACEAKTTGRRSGGRWQMRY